MPLLTLKNIFGQSAAIDWIKLAYQADRLPHGLIFAGQAGVGKGTTAQALAALFLCQKPKDADACGTCESCRLMAAGTHPDFGFIYRQMVRTMDKKEESKAKDLVIDVIRKFLLEPASLKPMMGRGRVFIVDEAQTMNPAAQNSLLKTLEEPFGRTLIILLTDDDQSLLQTIRSRTQVVRFGALDTKTVLRELDRRGIDRAIAERAAALSEGSLGSALRWIEDGIVDSAGQLLEMMDSLIAGRPPADLADWFKKSADAYAEKQVARDKNTSLDQAKREGLGLYLRLAAQRFRRLLRESADPRELELACEAIETLARADDFLDANVNIPIIFQQLALTLARLRAA